MAGGDGHVIHIQAKEDGGNYSTLSHSNPQATTRECGSLEYCFDLLLKTPFVRGPAGDRCSEHRGFERREQERLKCHF